MKSISAAFGQASLALSKITATVVATVAAGLFALGMSQPASATVLDDTGCATTCTDTFSVSFNVVIDEFTVGSTVPTGETLTLIATITYLVTRFDETTDPDEIDIQITVENNSISSAGLDLTGKRVDIAVIGFATNPDTGAVSIAPGTIFDFADLGFIPNLKAVIEVCASPKSCKSSGDVGIGIGGSDTFTLTLKIDDLSGGVDITDPGIKFQTDFGSFEILGNGNGGFVVPEPASLLLFGIGLLGLGVFVRRRRFAA